MTRHESPWSPGLSAPLGSSWYRLTVRGYTVFLDESGDHGLVSINRDSSVLAACGGTIAHAQGPIRAVDLG